MRGLVGAPFPDVFIDLLVDQQDERAVITGRFHDASHLLGVLSYLVNHNLGIDLVRRIAP